MNNQKLIKSSSLMKSIQRRLFYLQMLINIQMKETL